VVGRIVNGPRNLPTLGRAIFPSWRGSAINRLSDQGLRFWAVDRGA
jgi:hypothetical protein